MLSAASTRQLDEQGYLILPEFMGNRLLQEVRERTEELYALEGDRAGAEFKLEPGARRLANLVNKGAVFERLIETPEILDGMAHVLGPEFKLSSLNIRSANPGSGGQPLHADSGALPDDRGYWVCNSLWMLDAFTTENGAVRVVPGSHRWGRLPDPGEPVEGDRLVTGPAGTVVIMNAHMWHGGTPNRTANQRRAMHIYYTRSDKPQQQYQKALLSPAVQGRLSPRARLLCALDDPQNDELSAAGSGMSGFLK